MPRDTHDFRLPGRRRISRALAALLVGGALLAGCGDGDEQGPARPPQPERVTAAERKLIDSFDSRIATHCIRVSQGLVDPSAGPTRRQARQAFRDARRLIALAAEKPSAPLGAGQDLRLFVSDVLENLEGSNCDPRMLALLSEGLARIPQQ